ncbi:MAG: iron-containing alcohol dehydrogenase [Nitrospirae bacterium]|nr:MAG: iron-containing alcohol dehydrogenase [Nitrospirota bacterium]
MNFTFQLPTKIFFGLECVAKNSAEFAQWGTRALIVTGRSSARASGALPDIQQALAQHGITWTVYDEIEENPSLAAVETGGAAARDHRADMIIGIGGGSPLDAAKAIAVLAVNEMRARQLFGGNFPAPPLPIIAVPLTAGTGSEVTQYSILTDTERRTKRSFANRCVFPKAAFLDARYTQSLSRSVTINTGIDALSHAVEGYLSRRGSFMSDQLALDAIRQFGKAIEALGKDVLTIEERERLLYVSLLGGMVIAQTGTTMVHSLGYSLTYFRNIPHGRANGLLLTEALRFNQAAVPEKIAAILAALGMKTLDELKTALSQLLGAEKPCTPDEIETFANIAIQATNIANTPRIPDVADLKMVLADSLPSS